MSNPRLNTAVTVGKGGSPPTLLRTGTGQRMQLSFTVKASLESDRGKSAAVEARDLSGGSPPARTFPVR